MKDLKLKIYQKDLKDNDFELEEIADRIKEGYTSGRVDGEGGKYVSWELKIEEWGGDEKDEDEEDAYNE